MNFPIVTLGVASYNNANYITTTLDSIGLLDYPSLQIIVVDDASTDNSVAVIRQWIRDNEAVKIHFEIQESNAGICSVLSRMLALAQGEFFSFIGSDDIWRPDFVRQMVEKWDTLSSDYAVVYGDIVRINELGEVLNEPRPEQPLTGFPQGNVFIQLLQGNFMPAMAQLTRTAAIREIGGFDESLDYEDWDLWLRLARRYKFSYLPKIVAEYRIHNKSVMRNPARFRALVESTLSVLSKHLGLGQQTDYIIHKHFARLARELYEADGSHARKWLWRSWRWHPSVRHSLYALLTGLGVSYSQLVSAKRFLKRGGV